jgi:hypothetical protein
MAYVTNAYRIEYRRGEQSIILRLLTRKLGELPEAIQTKIQSLPLEQLETLGETLLEFENLVDLETWLARSQNERQ